MFIGNFLGIKDIRYNNATSIKPIGVKTSRLLSVLGVFK